MGIEIVDEDEGWAIFDLRFAIPGEYVVGDVVAAAEVCSRGRWASRLTPAGNTWSVQANQRSVEDVIHSFGRKHNERFWSHNSEGSCLESCWLL